jgi:hypothetical protein
MDEICNGNIIIDENLQKEIEKDLIDQYDYSLKDAEKFAKENRAAIVSSIWDTYYKYLDKYTKRT